MSEDPKGQRQSKGGSVRFAPDTHKGAKEETERDSKTGDISDALDSYQKEDKKGTASSSSACTAKAGSSSSSSKSEAGAASSGGSAGGCCCLRRAKEPPFQQTLVILRHSERRDYMDPSYKSSEEGLAWPHDTPLTEAGITLAADVAKELEKVHMQANFHVIACSPYRRCMQTAAEVAKLLNLPVLIDQEIGEVRDRTMPKEPSPHRSPTELEEMAASLGVKTLNPVLEDGGVKIFGKPPVWPETLEDAKNRYIVRIETYIRQSMETRQNMIIVTHADAVAAALVMFERGGADVQNMGFCARIIATRTLPKKEKNEEHGVFAAQWALEFKDLGAELFADQAMAKYYENQHLAQCDETQQMVAMRKDKRTKTDMLFDNSIKDLLAKKDAEEDEEDRV